MDVTGNGCFGGQIFGILVKMVSLWPYLSEMGNEKILPPYTGKCARAAWLQGTQNHKGNKKHFNRKTFHKYDNIPKLFTFSTRVGNIEAIALYSRPWSKT